MIEAVRHMSPKTYRYFRWFRAQLDDPASPLTDILKADANFSTPIDARGICPGT